MIPDWCCITYYNKGCVVSTSDGSIYEAVPTFEREPYTNKRVEALNINLLPSNLVGWVELKEIEE